MPRHIERFVNLNEAAKLIGFSPSWCRKQIQLTRAENKQHGPPFRKVGGQIRYRMSDLVAWVETATEEERGKFAFRHRPGLGERFGRLWKDSAGRFTRRIRL